MNIVGGIGGGRRCMGHPKMRRPLSTPADEECADSQSGVRDDVPSFGPLKIQGIDRAQNGRTLMNHRLAPLALTAAFLGITGTAVAAPPGPADGSFNYPCPTFLAHLTVTGKGGTIPLPGGAFKAIAPDQRVTITNPETGASVSYLITGVTHVATQPDESLAVTATGSNVILVPKANGHPAGLFFTRGTVSWTLNPDFSERTLFTSQGGQVTDVCALID